MIMSNSMGGALLVHTNAMTALLAVAFLTFGVTVSSAADLVGAQPTVEVPPAQAYADGTTYLWSGPYAGIYTGYNALGAALSGERNVDDVHGVTGGAYAGYNFQLDDIWVTGVEGTLGLSAADGAYSGVSVDQDWEASLRARMGIAFENSLIYGVAGIGGTDVNVSSGSASDSNILLGWQVGAGLETFLTENVTGRLEYGYADYASREFSLGSSGKSNVDLSGHNIKLGVGFKF